MRRRTILRTAPVGMGVAYAGCLSRASFGATESTCLEDGAVSFDAESDEFIVITGNNAVESHGFELRNQAACPISVNPAAWRIEQWSGDGWKQVASGDGEEKRITISGGGVHEWSLSLTPHPSPHTDSATFIVADLPEARYTLEVNGLVEDTERITRRAQFHLTKQPAETNTDA